MPQQAMINDSIATGGSSVSGRPAENSHTQAGNAPVGNGQDSRYYPGPRHLSRNRGTAQNSIGNLRAPENSGTGERDSEDLRHHPAFGSVQWGLPAILDVGRDQSHANTDLTRQTNRVGTILRGGDNAETFRRDDRSAAHTESTARQNHAYSSISAATPQQPSPARTRTDALPSMLQDASRRDDSDSGSARETLSSASGLRRRVNTAAPADTQGTSTLEQSTAASASRADQGYALNSLPSNLEDNASAAAHPPFSSNAILATPTGTGTPGGRAGAENRRRGRTHLGLDAFSDFDPGSDELLYYQTPLPVYLRDLFHENDVSESRREYSRNFPHSGDELTSWGNTPSVESSVPSLCIPLLNPGTPHPEKRFADDSGHHFPIFSRDFPSSPLPTPPEIVESPTLATSATSVASATPASSSSSTSSSSSQTRSSAVSLLQHLPPLSLSLREACGDNLAVYTPNQYLHALYYHMQEVKVLCDAEITDREAREEEEWIKPVGKNWDLGKAGTSVSLRGFPRECCMKLIEDTEGLEIAIMDTYLKIAEEKKKLTETIWSHRGQFLHNSLQKHSTVALQPSRNKIRTCTDKNGQKHEGEHEINVICKRQVEKITAEITTENLKQFSYGSEERIVAEVILQLLLLRDEYLVRIQANHHLGNLVILQARIPENSSSAQVQDLLARNDSSLMSLLSPLDDNGAKTTQLPPKEPFIDVFSPASTASRSELSASATSTTSAPTTREPRSAQPWLTPLPLPVFDDGQRLQRQLRQQEQQMDARNHREERARQQAGIQADSEPPFPPNNPQSADTVPQSANSRLTDLLGRQRLSARPLAAVADELVNISMREALLQSRERELALLEEMSASNAGGLGMSSAHVPDAREIGALQGLRDEGRRRVAEVADERRAADPWRHGPQDPHGAQTEPQHSAPINLFHYGIVPPPPRYVGHVGRMEANTGFRADARARGAAAAACGGAAPPARALDGAASSQGQQAPHHQQRSTAEHPTAPPPPRAHANRAPVGPPRPVAARPPQPRRTALAPAATAPPARTAAAMDMTGPQRHAPVLHGRSGAAVEGVARARGDEVPVLEPVSEREPLIAGRRRNYADPRSLRGPSDSMQRQEPEVASIHSSQRDARRPGATAHSSSAAAGSINAGTASQTGSASSDNGNPSGLSGHANQRQGVDQSSSNAGASAEVGDGAAGKHRCACDGCTFGAAQSWLLSEGTLNRLSLDLNSTICLEASISACFYTIIECSSSSRSFSFNSPVLLLYHYYAKHLLSPATCQPLLIRHDTLSIAYLSAQLQREAARQRRLALREREDGEREKRKEENLLWERSWDTMFGLRYPWVRKEFEKVRFVRSLVAAYH